MSRYTLVQRYLYWRDVTPVEERSRANWRYGMALFCVVWGGGYLFGPDAWSSTTQFSFIHMFVVPINVYGALTVAVGICAFTRWWNDGFFVGFVFYNLWTLCLFASWVTAPITAWGAPLTSIVVTGVFGRLSRPSDNLSRQTAVEPIHPLPDES